jgi:hypothetical protein
MDKREAFLAALDEITVSAAQMLYNKAQKVYDKLTCDERDKFSLGGEQPMRLARTIMVACADEVEWQFSAEAITGAVKSIKRLRKSRYC